MTDKSQKQKGLKLMRRRNVLEGLKDIGDSSIKTFKTDLLQRGSEDIFAQLFGQKEEKRSGELIPGESLEMGDVFSGKAEENKKLKEQILLERGLAEQENRLIREKSDQLKLQLKAIMDEVAKLAEATSELSTDVKIAAIEAPAEPGSYHVIFFEKLLSFIISFRKKIEDSSIWLQAANARAQKKNYWSTYKKKGSSFLLSPDHYLQRSAG